MSVVWYDQPAAEPAVDHERSIITAIRPRVPLPEQLAARQHEREIAQAEARQRWVAWLCAIALAVGILWCAR